MKITPTRTIPVRDAEYRERIVDKDGNRWIVDTVARRDDVKVECFPAGKEATRRTVLTYKATDVVTVELAPEEAKQVLAILAEALIGAADHGHPFSISAEGDTLVVTSSDDTSKPWRLELEPS